MAQPLLMFVGNLEPPAEYQFTVGGVAAPLTGGSVKFSMRAIGSDVPLIDHVTATIVDPVSGTVEYDWVAGDTLLSGMYAAWFTFINTAGKSQDAPDFMVEVRAHATLGVKALVTYEELVSYMKTQSNTKQPQESDRENLESLIMYATSACESYTDHRYSIETAASKDFLFDGNDFVNLAPWDLNTCQSITMDTDWSPMLLDTTQYRLEPRNKPYGVTTHIVILPSPFGGMNFWGGPMNPRGTARAFGRQVTVVGNWGWPAIPEGIKFGVKALVTRVFNNPLSAQVVRTANVEYQFSRGAISGGSSAGDDLPLTVKTAWQPFMRSGLAG